jgi:hypothetical protein
MAKEAVRIQPPHRGTIALRNSPSWNCNLRLEAQPKGEKLPTAWKKPHVARKTATKARKMA